MIFISIKLLDRVQSKNPNGKIVTLGELLVDFIPADAGMLLKDKGTVIKTASGSAGIAAVAAANFSSNAGFIGKVGKDSLSQFVYNAIADTGVDLSHTIIADDGQIGLAFLEYTKKGRNYEYYRSNSVGSKFSQNDINEDYIKACFAIHYSGMLLELSDEMQSACMKSVKIAHENGVLVSLDLNIRAELIKRTGAKERLIAALKTADIISPTLDEARYITGENEIEDVLRVIHTMGPKIVALTRDKDGAVLSCDGEIYYADGIDVNAIDPTGAGDTFAAALIYCIQKGYTLQTSANFCNCAGTLVTMKRGVIGVALPSLEEVLALMQEHNFAIE